MASHVDNHWRWQNELCNSCKRPIGKEKFTMSSGKREHWACFFARIKGINCEICGEKIIEENYPTGKWYRGKDGIRHLNCKKKTMTKGKK